MCSPVDDDCEGTCGRHAEGVHGLADQVLAEHRTHRGLAVAPAGERGATRPLQVDVATAALGVDDLAQRGAPARRRDGGSSHRTGARRRPSRSAARRQGRRCRPAQPRRRVFGGRPGRRPARVASTSLRASRVGSGTASGCQSTYSPASSRKNELSNSNRALLVTAMVRGYEEPDVPGARRLPGSWMRRPLTTSWPSGWSPRALPSGRWSSPSRVVSTPRCSAWPRTRALPGAAWLVTADSASLADGELEHCRTFAEQWSLPWRPAATGRARRRSLPRQRHRPVLLVQVGADGPARADRRRARRLHRARRERRRPRRSPARSAGGRRARRPVPDGRRRAHEGRRPPPRPALGPRRVGSAGDAVPVVAHPVRHGGERAPAQPHRSGGSGGARVRLPRRARSPLRRHGAASSCPPTTSCAPLRSRPTSPPPWPRPVTGTSRSISRACGPATSTPSR